MSSEAYLKENGMPNGKYIIDVHSIEGGLIKICSELMEEHAEMWKGVLGVNSVNLMELGRMLMIGGLTEVLGENYLLYLREKKGYSQELIEESIKTYNKCFAYWKKEYKDLSDKMISAELVDLGHSYVDIFNPTSRLGKSLYDQKWLRDVILGKIKPDISSWR